MSAGTHRAAALLTATLAVSWGAALSHPTVTTAQTTASPSSDWIEAGKGGRLPGEMTFANSLGRLGVVMTSGALDTQGHPFFTPLGVNGRACVTCHQPANAMSLSVAMLRERWFATSGHDPVFAAIDGSNNPALPQDKASSHSLLLNRGLFRVGLPWPPRPIAGRPVAPEFTIEVISDPTGVNGDPTYGFKSGQPTISVFRRPRPAANLKYVMAPDAIFNIKTGELTARDPDTGEPVGMNLMADSRHLTLKQQALAAYSDHQEGHAELAPRQLQAIVDFETQVYVAQARRVTIALSPSDTACDRACLVGLADQYMTALAARAPSSLPLAPNVTFTENGSRMPMGDGVWKLQTKLVTRRDVFADPSAGQVALWGVLDEGGSPALLSVRLRIQDRRITEIETVVARKGSHALFAPETFATPTPVFQQPLEPGQRSPRDRMIAIANGYFEGIEKHDARLVSSATGCNRFENGVQMTNRSGASTPRACATAVDRLTHIKAVRDRRYDVVDEERGVVLSMVLFDIPADAGATPPRGARMLLLAELFKIVSGEIQRIETVMHNLPYGSGSGWAVR